MAIKFTCDCGTQFVAREDQIGSSGTCHFCKKPFTVPDPNPPPIPQDEPKPTRTPFWFEDPIVGIPLGIFILVICVFALGIFSDAHPPQPTTQETSQTQSPEPQEPAEPVVTAPKPRQYYEWAMPQVAEKAVTTYLEMIFKSHKHFNNFQILNIDVRAEPPDNRKIPWLWRHRHRQVRHQPRRLHRPLPAKPDPQNLHPHVDHPLQPRQKCR